MARTWIELTRSFRLPPCICTAGAQKLKVFISVDMEGIAGVVHSDQTGTGPEYNTAHKWMAEDANAAIAGALMAGATEVVVNDSHGDMRNILTTDLHQAATLISGTPKPLGMMQGIDATFDAAMFIGYHAKARTADATLDHTISGATVYYVKINGTELPELGIKSLIAGHFNVPVVLVSGNRAVREQAAIRKRKEIKPCKTPAPYRFELAYLRSSQADNAMAVPGMKRINARAVQIESSDVVAGY